MTTIRRFSDHRPKLLEQQPENGLALAFGPVLVLAGVMEDVAGGAPLKTAAGPVIECVGGDFHDGRQVGRHAGGPLATPVQGGLQVTNAFFLGPVVARKMRWIVQRQHAEACQDRIHLLIVERRAIVPFKEQGRPRKGSVRGIDIFQALAASIPSCSLAPNR